MMLKSFPRFTQTWLRLKRLEKIFLSLCLLQIVARGAARLKLPVPGQGVLDFLFVVFALLVGISLTRRLLRRMLWRLRNRLLVSYIFIGVVPVVLIVCMVALSSYILVGQVATYLVSSELQRRNLFVQDGAFALARSLADAPPDRSLEEQTRNFVGFLENRIPGFQAVVKRGRAHVNPLGEGTVTGTPEWSRPGFMGLVSTSHGFALAAHVQLSSNKDPVEVFAFEPADPGLLDSLLPGFASIRLAQLNPSRSRDDSLEALDVSSLSSLPSSKRWWDWDVWWVAPVSARPWTAGTERTDQFGLVVVSRPSLMIELLFSSLGELVRGLRLALYVIVFLFLVVEALSLMIGVGLTRTITRSVADLYQATRKIKVGDFSHRIPIRAHDQLSELAGSFNSMTENLQRLIAESKEKERLESELAIAREVQGQLFPKAVPRLRTLELAGHCSPARMVSGDYYDFVRMDAERTILAIGDIAGKGISAALLMASIQSSLRVQLGYRRGEDQEFPISELVSRLNQQLFDNTSSEKFASFCCAVYREQDGRLAYTNAGHLPPLLIRKGSTVRLEVNGMVLGAFPGQSYGQSSLDLEPGDLLVAFTDGVTEPENEYGEEFGEQRLADLILTHQRLPLPELVKVIFAAVQEWAGSPESADDMTILLARRI
ncbi:MAG: SpoIIE family protein phosphatase [Acidobacteriota bacterium]